MSMVPTVPCGVRSQRDLRHMEIGQEFWQILAARGVATQSGLTRRKDVMSSGEPSPRRGSWRSRPETVWQW